jgi:hypothetical protein
MTVACWPGLQLNPETKANVLWDILNNPRLVERPNISGGTSLTRIYTNWVKMILVMTVHLGLGGQILKKYQSCENDIPA